MAEYNEFVVKKGKVLKCGYTTGSCAAAASKAAAMMLLWQKKVDVVEIITPSGIKLTLDVFDAEFGEDYASCSIEKRSGDDPDVTNGIHVFSKVSYIESGIKIDGGVGVGRVTKPGLDQPVGNAAINSTPRRMITEELTALLNESNSGKGLYAEISIPAGVEIAKKTFNPRMGIEGGISVLGTSGIVDPMSTRALVDTIKVQLSQLAAARGNNLLLVPGNYGEKYTKDVLKLKDDDLLECSNYLGDSLDLAFHDGFKNILIVSHIGKFVKLGIGMTNTHSSNGDGRIETLLMCAIHAGADLETLKRISDCVTTDAVLDILKETGYLEETLEILKEKIIACLERRTPSDVNLGFVCFTNTPGFDSILFKSDNADGLMEIWK